MRKFIGLIGAVLIAMAGRGFAQTQVSIPSVTASKGDTVVVPVNIANFDSVGAVSLVLSYDASALTYLGYANPLNASVGANNPSSGTVKIAWFDATTTSPINLASGTLINLKFIYNGGNGAITINTAQSSIANESGTTIPTTFTNGTVSGGSVTLSLGTGYGTSGGTVNVPLTVSSLMGVGAISLKINYDATVATFDSVTGAPAGVTFTAHASGGVISLGWFQGPGAQPLNISSGTLVKLAFTYNTGTTSLTFNTSQSQVADTNATPLTVVYNSGSISPNLATAVGVSIDTVHAQAGGTAYVPLRVKNFNGVGAISLKIAYNSAVLTFQKLANYNSGVDSTTITANAASGVLSIAWFQGPTASPLTLGNAKFADLVFTYNGGSTTLAFQTAQCQISDSNANTMTSVYTNGLVSLQTMPHFQPLATQSVGQGDTLRFVATAVDSDGSALTYSMTGQPSGAKLNASTGAFLWVASHTVTSYTVKFKAATASGLFDTLSVLITVLNTDKYPSIINQTPAPGSLTKINIGTAVTFSITAVDPNPNDKLTIRWSLNNVTQKVGTDTTFTHTFTSRDSGFAKVVVSVSDLAGQSVTQSWTPLVTGIQMLEGLPTKFALSQNYPNPFNPTTNISFDVSKPSNVVIVVYDILGQQVRTLVDQNMMPGRYNETWDGTNNLGQQVTSGIYFYRMQAGNFVQMKKMMFLK